MEVNIAFSVSSVISVVVFQVIVHYWLSGRKYIAEGKERAEVEALEQSCLLLESKDGDDRSHTSARSPREEVLHSLSQSHIEDISSSSFDGAEPEIFFELLSQTGSEMTAVSNWKREHSEFEDMSRHTHTSSSFLTFSEILPSQFNTRTTPNGHWMNEQANSPCILVPPSSQIPARTDQPTTRKTAGTIPSTWIQAVTTLATGSVIRHVGRFILHVCVLLGPSMVHIIFYVISSFMFQCPSCLGEVVDAIVSLKD